MPSWATVLWRTNMVKKTRRLVRPIPRCTWISIHSGERAGGAPKMDWPWLSAKRFEGPRLCLWHWTHQPGKSILMTLFVNKLILLLGTCTILSTNSWRRYFRVDGSGIQWKGDEAWPRRCHAWNRRRLIHRDSIASRLERQVQGRVLEFWFGSCWGMSKQFLPCMVVLEADLI